MAKKTTKSHYSTNKDGIINAGPYTGLTPSEAKDLNSSQWEDYRSKNKDAKQADFNKKITDATGEFAKDYVIPAIKAAGAFNPIAGPIIGGMDAYQSYKEGNTGAAILGAGLEALPYGGKYVAKGIKFVAPSVRRAISGGLKSSDDIQNGIFGDTLWDGLLPSVGRGDLPKGGHFRKIGNDEGLKDLIESGVVRQPEGPSSFTGTQGTYYSKGRPIEDYSGRFAVHSSNDNNFQIPRDKRYPHSVRDVELDDPRTTVYKRRFMRSKYDKIDKNNLESELGKVDKYDKAEGLLKFGTRWGARVGAVKGIRKSFEDDIPKKQNGGQLNYNKNIMYNPRNIRYARGGGLPEYSLGGDTALGAGQGALSGAAAGMAFGPWGAAVGGLVGGTIGGVKSYMGSKSEMDQQAIMDQQAAQNQRVQMAQNSLQQPNLNIQGTQNFKNGGDLPNIPTANAKNIQIPYKTDSGRQFWPMRPTADIIRDTANFFPIGVGDNKEPIFGTYDESLAEDSLRYKSKLDENNKVFHPSSLLRKLASQPPTEQFLKSQPGFDFPGFANGGDLNQQEGNGNFTTYEGQDHNGPNGGIPVDQMGNPSIVSGEEPVGLTENKESTFDGYVFSEELKPDGKKSFSDLAKALNKKYYG